MQTIPDRTTFSSPSEMTRSLLMLFLAIGLTGGGLLARVDAKEIEPAPADTLALPTELDWHDDYLSACDVARESKKMLLIYFHRSGEAPICRQFEKNTLADEKIKKLLKNYVLLKASLESKVELPKEGEVVLHRHPSFAEMCRLPGIAILDFAHPEKPHYKQVVSVFPFLRRKAYSPEQMRVILELPPGTVTQRTMIYAVRTHPDRPKSTDNVLDPYLVSEATAASAYQAKIGVQGHHHWERRFHKINRKLPNHLWACEVCAESWPRQGMLESAIECVRCWRLSSGHWSAVKADQPRYGYDMRRGRNGIWYGTGIFGKRRYPSSRMARNPSR
jgi:hypothetical protein